MSDDFIDRYDMPLLQRLFLKFPKLSLEGFPTEFQGIFWIVIKPTLVFLNIFIFVWVPTPMNYVALAVFNTFVALFIVRILFERALNSRNSLMRQCRFRWDMDNALRSYLKIVQKEKKIDPTAKETSG